MFKAPQINSRFTNDSRLPRWWSLRFNKKAKPDEPAKPDSKNIEALLSAVNSSSQHVRNFYVTFLLAGLYIAIIIWSTTDMMLLKETPVNLPLLNAELPITGFYQFAPYFYLLIHFNLLLQLCLLSDILHGYNAALSKLEDNEAREYYDIRLFPFAFSHTLSGTQHSGFLKILLTAMVWITMIWLPLCLLIGLQVGFLAYHSVQVLELQRWAIVADLFILTVFWPIIRSPDGKWMSWVLCATGISALLQRFNTRSSGMPILEGFLSLVTLMVVVGFSYGVAVLPDSDNEVWVAEKVLYAARWLDNANEVVGLGEANEKDENSEKFVDAWLSERSLKEDGKHYFRLTEWLFDRSYQKDNSGKLRARDSIFHRNLRLREKLLIANELKLEDVGRLTDNDKQVPEEVLRKTVGLGLKGRDLHYADFSESLMPKVDFREINGVSTKLDYANFQDAKLFKARMMDTQLQGANLRGAQLQGAKLGEAQLQGADLYRAQLQGADLSGAQLQGANLYRAQLQGTNLSRAQLQGTVLYKAPLQGANLSGAQLQGTNLSGAQLKGANLNLAQLQGADLDSAQLQGVDLEDAKLQGADLSGVQLQGANLRRAQLQGADLIQAELQGANLDSAQLQGTDLNYANLTLSEITRAKFGKMPEQESKDLFKEMSQIIKNPRRLKKLQDRLSKAIKSPATLAKAQGQKVWLEEPDEIVQNAFKESKGDLTFANSESDYQNGLTDLLIELSCQDKWAATGIIRYHYHYHYDYRYDDDYYSRNMPLESSFAKCLLSLRVKKNKSGLAVCPGLSEISKEDIESLKRIALKKEPENSIQSTFKCETGMVN